jgi:hypothetical protein
MSTGVLRISVVVSISFCTTCRDRIEHLSQTFPTNASLLTSGMEMVILDYGSEWPITSLIRESARTGIKLFRIPRTPRHRMAHAKNVAHRLSTGDFLVNLDADNILTPEYLRWLQAAIHEDPQPIVFTHAWGGGGGRIGLSRRAFISLGGYDERFDGWGYDDNDLLERGRRIGIKAIKAPTAFVRFIRHGDALRGENPKETRTRAKRLSDAAIMRRELVANSGRAWGETPNITHESIL